MITGLGFGLEDTGLGLEENWPWPLEHAVLEPIPDTYSNYSQPMLTKLYNENIGGHLYTFTV